MPDVNHPTTGHFNICLVDIQLSRVVCCTNFHIANSVCSLFQAKYNVEYTSIRSTCNVVMDIQLISGCKVAIFHFTERDIHFALGALHAMEYPLCNMHYALCNVQYTVRSICRQGILLAVGATIYNPPCLPGPDTGPLLWNPTRMPLMIIKIAVEPRRSDNFLAKCALPHSI